MTTSDSSAAPASETPPTIDVAIVGSGPSGYYAAAALLKSDQVEARVDIFDRLPTPFGLVRGGVAPDHQKIKNVTRVYENETWTVSVNSFPESETTQVAVSLFPSS